LLIGFGASTSGEISLQNILHPIHKIVQIHNCIFCNASYRKFLVTKFCNSIWCVAKCLTSVTVQSRKIFQIWFSCCKIL